MIRTRMAGRPHSGGLGIDILNHEELLDIHRASLEVLWHTGVYVQEQAAIDVFARAGAVVNDKTKVVRIPPQVVEAAIESAPRKIVLRGREPKHDAVIEGRRVTFTNFGDAVTITDPYTGEHRETTKDDMAKLARVIDTLDIITIMEEMAAPHDVPPDVASLHAYEALVLNSSKHINIGPLEAKTAEQVIAMATAVQKACRPDLPEGPGNLPISFLTCPVSPLRLVDSTCEIIMTAAKHSLPCNILSMAMSGGSAPVHLAGTLVSHNAEVLSGLTLAQLVNPGTPIIYGSSTTSLDLKTASATVGSPELALISASVASLARFYQLPSWVAGA